MDLGSLNGTSLNGRIISTSNRRRGRLWRLNDGDEIKLGQRSTLKIIYLPLQGTRVYRLLILTPLWLSYSSSLNPACLPVPKARVTQAKRLPPVADPYDYACEHIIYQ